MIYEQNKTIANLDQQGFFTVDVLFF